MKALIRWIYNRWFRCGLVSWRRNEYQRCKLPFCHAGECEPWEGKLP